MSVAAELFEHEVPEIAGLEIPSSDGGSSYDEPTWVYLLFEQRDEDQIIQQLLGASLQQFVYSVDVDGSEVCGVSWAGIQELRRLHKGIATSIVACREEERKGERGIWAQVKALDKYTANEAEAAKFMPYLARRRNGRRYRVPFPEEVAISKSKRNAVRELLPQWLINRFVELVRTGAETVTEEMLRMDEARSPNGNPGSSDSDGQVPTRLTEGQMRAARARLEQLEALDNLSPDQMRRAIWYRLLLLSDGDIRDARDRLKEITADGDASGFASVTDIPEGRVGGSKASLLEAVHSQVERLFAERGKEGGEADEGEEFSPGQVDSAEEAERQVRILADRYGVSVAALKAAAIEHASAQRFSPALWPLVLAEWKTIATEAKRRSLSETDRKEAEAATLEQARERYLEAFERTHDDASRKVALEALKTFTGIRDGRRLTTAHYLLGARVAESL